MVIAWGIGRKALNELRIQRLNTGVNVGLLLDVVVFGVLNLDKALG